MRPLALTLALLGACSAKEASVATRTQASATPLAAQEKIATATFALG